MGNSTKKESYSKKSSNSDSKNAKNSNQKLPKKVNKNSNMRDKKKSESKRGCCTYLLILIVAAISILGAVFPIFKLSLEKPIKANFIQLPELPALEGNLKPNTLLQNVKIISKAIGAETIEFSDKGLLYTGLLNGQIVQVDMDGTINKIVQIGPESNETLCNDFSKGFHAHPSCGRPLGIRFKPNTNWLYVTDPYYGILKVDVVKKTKQVVLGPNDARFGNLPLKFADDLDLDGDVIYFVDSSYERDFNEAIEEHVEALARGRLYRFNEKTNNLEFLAENLYFPNGLQLSPSKDYVLISENTMSRILKFYINGEKKGKREVFADLPGFSDTLRLTNRNTLLVPFALPRYPKYLNMLDVLGEYPLIRSFLSSILNLGAIQLGLLPQYGLVAEYDLNGRPIKSWHDPKGLNVSAISTATFYNGKIYLGSFIKDFIAVVDY